jgi:nucleoside phosphorylase
MRKYKPRLFINFGAAGAINPKLEIGRVTVPKHIVGYTWPDFEPKGEPVECPVEPLGKIDRSIVITRAGSCPHDIRDAEKKTLLFERYQIDTTDWETHRLAEACRLLGTPFLAVRCVSDRSESRAGIEYARNATTALQRGARLLERLADGAMKIYHKEP